ncbi:MAG: nucleoside hydrolase [Rhodoferax sp.]
MPQRRHKVIYDTDPGVDDAMALYFALAHPAIDLIGIGTTFGNVTVGQAALNALYLTTIAGRNIPVTTGIAKPLRLPMQTPPAHIHGIDGLGNLPDRLPVRRRLDPRSSARFIVDMARAQPGEISVVAVGPLGNLSLALDLEPDLPRLLRQVIVMGGTLTEPGNVSPVAEANIWCDPHAAADVFNAGWKVTMVGLDVTHRVILPLSLFEKFAARHQHPATDTLLHAVRFYADFYSQRHPRVAAIRGCFGHDLLAFIYLVNPELFSTRSGRISISTELPTLGQTTLDNAAMSDSGLAIQESPPCLSQACTEVDAEACVTGFEQALMGRWLEP